MEVQVFSFMTSHGKYLTYRNTSSMYSLCIFCLLFILLITLKVGYSFQTSNLVKWPATSTYYYANHILYIQIVIDTACLSISRYYLCMELLHSHISFSVLTCYFFPQQSYIFWTWQCKYYTFYTFILINPLSKQNTY